MRKIWLFLPLIALALSGCGNMKQGKSAADAAVVDFHQKFNSQQMNAILDSASPRFFQVTPKATMANILTAVHNKLGNNVSSTTQTVNTQIFNGVTTVTLVQDTTFQKGKGTETFNFQIDGGKACLLGYNINSPDLIMN
jgi:hypothetical protein